MLERGAIEIAPLAYMRGRTLNHSFIILDEAQNTTPEQMKMFLTRIGFGSKAVVTGDVTQIDLARGQKSGLIEARRSARRACAASPSPISAREDVVRHPLVQRIVNAYENREARSARTAKADRRRAVAACAHRAVRDARARRAVRSELRRWVRAALDADARVTVRIVGDARRPRAQPRVPRQGLRDQRADVRAATTAAV